ncbi:tetratricopeptide repeat protein [Micromonospora chokoriensis]|uniref:tetratricopeptide repeat protein n=1 Tax=Micromonospora chokoriensis TaxID=356851 RepID=UPI0004C36036|nr:tetratricopeptide repeat protein [Micromonospora chokoriensis]
MTWPPPYLIRAPGPLSGRASLRNTLCLAENHDPRASIEALLILLRKTPTLRDRRRGEFGITARINDVVSMRGPALDSLIPGKLDVPTSAVISYVLDCLAHLDDPRSAAMLDFLALSAMGATVDRFGSALGRWRVRLLRNSLTTTLSLVAEELQGYGIATGHASDMGQAAALCDKALIPLWGVIAAFEDALWRLKNFDAFENAAVLRERRFIAARNQLLDDSWSDADYERLLILLDTTVHLVNAGPLSIATLRPQWLDRRSALEVAAYWGLERLNGIRRYLVEVEECHSTIHAGHSRRSGTTAAELFASLAQVWLESGRLAARQSLIERRSADLLPRYLFESVSDRLSNADITEITAAAEQDSHNVVDTMLHETWHMMTAAWPGHPELADGTTVSPAIGYTVEDGPIGPIINMYSPGHGIKGFFKAAARADGPVLEVASDPGAERALTQDEIRLALAASYLDEDLYASVVDLARLILAEDPDRPGDAVTISQMIERRAFAEMQAGRLEATEAAFAAMRTVCVEADDREGQLRARNGIAGVWGLQGHPRHALDLCLRNLQDSLEWLGPEHIWTTVCRVAVAIYRVKLGNFDEAIAEYEEVIRVREQQLGVDAPETLKAQADLGVALYEKGDLSRAREVLLACLGRSDVVLGADSYSSNLARTTLKRFE